jgi:mono/diheme cytochrome c family protein
MSSEVGDAHARSGARRKIAVGLVAAFGLVAAVALPAMGKVSQKAAGTRSAVTIVKVTAGKPTELGFKLSTKKVAPGLVTFKVTNAGRLGHSFKICASAKGGSANACVGKTTPVLAAGKSATLTVTLKKGLFEYLCTVPGHAAAGMKGVLGAGVTPTTTPNPNPAPTPVTTTSPGTTTTVAAPPPATAPLIGDPVAGQAVFSTTANPPCASCHTLKAAGSTATVGPNLDSLAPDQGTVVTAVTYGLPGGMPAFGQTNLLTSTQINNVAAFVYKSTHQ